jgi:thioester reductase-like protein
MDDNILLIGCTGFIGQCIIFNILEKTTNNIYLIIRSKNNVNIEDRLDIILKNIKLGNRADIKKRIKIINVEYQKDNNMNIFFINNNDKIDIINNVNCVVNGLADINFSRPLVKAVQNNTLTAYNWLNLIKKCKNKCKYIYLSTCYVNYHLDNTVIKEKVYEKNMNEETLFNILQNKITSYKPYCNTYCYSKQLTEIILINNHEHVNLHIIRPSIVCPAYKSPYIGYGDIQTINLFYYGMATGKLPFIYLNNDTQLNSIIPVDFVAEECINKINNNNTNFSITHCSLNNDNLTAKKLINLCNNFLHENNDFYIKGEKCSPCSPIISTNIGYILLYTIYYIILQLINNVSIYEIWKSLQFTYKLTYVSFFIKKHIIFHTDKEYENVDILSIYNNYLNNYFKDQLSVLNL